MIRYVMSRFALLFFVSIFTGAVAIEATAAELLVSDRATARVLAFDAESGEFNRVVVDQDPDNLSSPAAMTLGFGGDLFVASQAAGKVLRYNAITGAPNGSTPGSPVFLDLLNGPAGLLYDAAHDRLFVSTLGNADSAVVKIFDGAGTEIGMIDAGPESGRTGMAMDAAGNLYVNSFNEDGFGFGESGAVLKFDAPDFTNMTTLIEGDGDFDPSEPVIAGMNGLTLDDSGNLYAASLFGQQVIKLTTDGTVTGVIGSAMPPTAYPSGVLLDGDSNLLVSTLGNDNPEDPIYGELTFPGSVQKFAPDGTFQEVLIDDGDALNQSLGFQPTSMVLVPSPVPGEFDGDGDVDGADFVIWQTNFPTQEGAMLATGDADGDGDVDGADFVIWQTNFPTAPGFGSSPVPEPTGWWLAVMGLGMMICLHRITLSLNPQRV